MLRKIVRAVIARRDRDCPHRGLSLSLRSNLTSKSLLAVLSAILLVLSFPNFSMPFFAWVAFVPLFFALEGKKAKESFLISYAVGAIFFFGTIWWLIHVTLPGMIILLFALSLFFGLFGLAATVIVGNPAKLFVLPAAWVSLEWLRSNVLTGFGWALVGYSQTPYLPVIQIADIFGTYGISFLIMLVNIAIYLNIKDWKQMAKANIIIIVIVFAALGYGLYRMNNIFIGDEINIGIVQGNIPQEKKWDANFKESIIAKYELLTKELARSRPDLIIWPETSVPGFLPSDEDLFRRVKALATKIKTPLLVGAPRNEARHEGIYYNSAILFDGDGSIMSQYDKLHLVPFGEYIPFKKLLEFVQQFAPVPIGSFSAGKEYSVFRFLLEASGRDADSSIRVVKNIRFSCLICFEDIFPGLSREFVKKGAAFLVNMTNDAWFKISSAPYQHAQCSIMRAVENRVNVIRAANTGLSCFIDQKGRVLSRVEKDNKDIFVDGTDMAKIVVTKTRTFYTLYGDVFVYACLIFSLVYIVMASFFKTRR